MTKLTGRLCAFEGCGRPYYSMNWCHGHYNQSRRAGGMYPLFSRRTANGEKGWCAADDCGRRRVRKGLCEGHYQQQRAGKPLSPLREVKFLSPKGTGLAEKLEAARARADVSGDGCWNWPGSGDKRGYGKVREAGGKGWMSHRAAYHVWVGPIPEGSVIHHRCSNTSCFNPKHLQLTTHQDNAAEMRTRLALETEIARLRAEVADLRSRLASTLDDL